MSELSSTLSEPEQATLTTHEATIESGMRTFVEVGTALAAIRDARLYREDYGTFESYCQMRWSMERRQAYRLIDAAKAAEAVCPIGHIPQTESQARPLTTLETAEQQVKAWGIATRAGATPTAKDVQAAVEEVKAETAIEADEVIPPKPERVTYQPSNGIQYADNAISQLQKIQPNDTQRTRAFERVMQWIAKNK